MEEIPYVKSRKTVLIKRGVATVLYLVVALVVAGIVVLLGKFGQSRSVNFAIVILRFCRFKSEILKG